MCCPQLTAFQYLDQSGAGCIVVKGRNTEWKEMAHVRLSPFDVRLFVVFPNVLNLSGVGLSVATNIGDHRSL